ncbi:MAG TPA: integration host factor, actinobacterial type [Acidimicrobiia bacterium]|nr:integration host factor, actinobacterial type [Acidimicrobiia bacterium]
MTSPKPPQITPEQRAAALAKAGEARRIRAEIKELLKTGSLTLREVFDRAESEDYVAGLKVESLLEALPGMGKIGAKRLLESLEIAPNRRIRGLGERQRKALLATLG